MKRIVIVILIISFTLFGKTYNNNKINKNTINIDTQNQIELKENSVPESIDRNITNHVEDNEAHKINQIFTKENDIIIDNKPVLGLNLNDIVKNWGKYKELYKSKVKIPGIEEDEYIHVLKYNDIEIDLYTIDKDIDLSNSLSFRFDIVSDKYTFYGIKLGITEEEYLQTVENKEIFSFDDIINDNITDRKGHLIFENCRHILIALRENNYYKNYDKVAYKEIINLDYPNKVLGVVILFKDNKILRIVCSNPNAG